MTNPRSAPEDATVLRRVFADLYQHCAERRLPWLDELVIAAGYRHRCPRCAAMAPVDVPCPDCAGVDETSSAVRDLFNANRCTPEAVWQIPGGSRDRPLRIGIATVGGGTLGRAYAFNNWIYGVWLGGRLIRCGVDLRSGGAGKDHRQMAVLLAEHLADEHATDQRTRQRLAQWIDAQSHRARDK